MNAAQFTAVLAESRNGANEFFRHPLARRVVYSDGVQSLAETGCYWMLDILATELPAVFRDATKNPHGEFMAVVSVVAKDGKANLALTFEDSAPPAWSKDIEFTTLPDCDFTMVMSNDDGQGERYTLILITEY